MGLLRDLGRAAYLLDDEVAVPLADDALDVGALMTGKDEEPARVRTNRLVLREPNFDPFSASEVCAFADELLAPFPGRRPELFDLLVDVAEDAFVRTNPALRPAH